MRIAFYAPMKPPDHPVPSGDRQLARLFLQALSHGGHQCEIACHFVSRDGSGDRARQVRLRDLGEKLAALLLRRYQSRPADTRPEAWFTYHLYHKAPDWLGPRVAASLGIPYFIAEASTAPKRAGGPWDIRRLLGDDDLRQTFSRAAASRVREQYDVPRAAAEINRTLQTVGMAFGRR